MQLRIHFAQQVANSRVVLMHDNEPEGITGFKPLAWELMTRGLQAQIGWPNNSSFVGKQPEALTATELEMIKNIIGR